MAKHYKIIKRDGEVVPLEISKIRQVIEWAAEGLSINPLELESNLHMRFRNDMTTKEIQENIIDTSLQLTTIDEPDWRILAARLKLMDLYKEVKSIKQYEGFGYGDFSSHIIKSIDIGLYDGDLLKQFTIDEIKEAGTFIDMQYDMDFDYAGANIMIQRYLISQEENPWELPQEAFLTAALMIERFQKKELRMQFVKETYEMFAKRKLSMATPMLMNLRKPFGNLSSCFITAMDDNRDSIFYVIDQIARISKNGGGAGLNVSRIRCKGSWIGGVPNASGGVIPWIRNVNDTVVSVNQQGKRQGACTVALDSWHMDIEDFLELQTENGDQRTKAFDIFPQVVVSDEFMRRVDNNQMWTLVDPHEIRSKFDVEIAELWGETFEKLYRNIESIVFSQSEEAGVDLKNLNGEEFEKAYKKVLSKKGKGTLEDKLCLKMIKRVNARELFKTIMKTQVETGMPYLAFKDAINRANPNKHDGMIGNGNLCVESYSNFAPSKFIGSKIEENDGKFKIITEIEAKTVHTCNLNSINLANIDNDLEKVCNTAVRLLDNAIDFTDVPIEEGEIHNKLYRTIGVGSMGLADYLAKHDIPYNKSKEVVSELFENIAFYTINASIDLAKDRGSYPKYEGSDWSKGLILSRLFCGKQYIEYDKLKSYLTDEEIKEFAKDETKLQKLFESFGTGKFKDLKAVTTTKDWSETRSKLIKYGIRNSHIQMIAPNTSSSLVQGCSASVLPIFSKFYFDKNSKGTVPIMPPFIKDKFWIYQEFKNISQKMVIDVLSEIQRWTDTGISSELILNLNLDGVNAKYMYETLIDAWKKNMKTIYYIRSIQKNATDASTKEECISCAG